MIRSAPFRTFALATLAFLLVACSKGPYPALLPFEGLAPPPPLPPGLVEGLQAQGAALQAAAADQQSRQP